MKKIKLLSLLIIIIVISLVGCSIDNTLYNARKYFKSAQSRPLNQNGKPTSQAIDDYTKTIKKCGYILTERKNSKEADDALFLLAQALFYKGNSQYQAKDQFDSLIRNFPNSPFVPESIMFIAQIHRQINEKNQAEIVLVEYIRKSESMLWHPRALLLLADFATQDKDFVKAQFWLEKILSLYPKSIEYKEASFLLAKNFYAKNDFQNSLNQCNKVVNARGINKSVKLDAKYYIALNLLMLNENQKSATEIARLLKVEARPEKIPQLKLLQGRIMLSLNKFKEGDEILQSIIKTNSRTSLAAEAYYRLAEYHYYNTGNVESAIENYNKAKAEFSGSDYFTLASNKYSALIQIYKGNIPSYIDSPKLYVENVITSADNFFNALSIPDSAYYFIDNVKIIPAIIKKQIDTLDVQITDLKSRLVSLSSTDLTEIRPDSILYETNPIVSKDNVLTDSLPKLTKEVNLQRDTLNLDSNQIQDSLEIEIASNDTLGMDKYHTDGENAENKNKSIDPNNQDQKQISALELQRTRLASVAEQFTNDLIPFSIFVKATLISKSAADKENLSALYDEMLLQYPTNTYTNALKLLIEGKPVRLVDTNLEAEETKLDIALDEIESKPDSAIVMLNRLTKSSYKNISIKANFRLGWFYTFERQDTITAKQYFNEVFKTDILSDYARMTQKFYNGSKYLFKQQEKESLVQKTMIDSIKKSIEADSLQGEIYHNSKDSDREVSPMLKDMEIQPFDYKQSPINKTRVPQISQPE